MKNVKTLIAAAILSSLSFASFAAVEVQSTPEGQQKVGTISANAGTNLGSLEEQLAMRRAAFRELHAWLAAPPAPRAVMLSGARQIGKTTLMLQAADALLRAVLVAQKERCLVPILRIYLGRDHAEDVDLGHGLGLGQR